MYIISWHKTAILLKVLTFIWYLQEQLNESKISMILKAWSWEFNPILKAIFLYANYCNFQNLCDNNNSHDDVWVCCWSSIHRFHIRCFEIIIECSSGYTFDWIYMKIFESWLFLCYLHNYLLYTNSLRENGFIYHVDASQISKFGGFKFQVLQVNL